MPRKTPQIMLRIIYVILCYSLIWLVVFPSLMIGSLGIMICSQTNPWNIFKEFIKVTKLSQFHSIKGINKYILTGE